MAKIAPASTYKNIPFFAFLGGQGHEDGAI
jgi:hypothetical protein